MTQITDLSVKTARENQKKKEVFMKKIFVFILAIMVVGVFASASFAFTADQGHGGAGDGYIELGNTNLVRVQLSANVEAKYGYTTTDGEGADYAASTYNSKGNGKVFATGSNSNTVVYKDGQGSIANPPDFVFGTVPSGWSTY